MRRNFYAPVLAVGERDEKRGTQRYLSRVINATIDVEVSPGRRVFVFISSRAYIIPLVNLNIILVKNPNKFSRPQNPSPTTILPGLLLELIILYIYIVP